MEKYSNLQKRKKEMRQRLIEVEKRLRMQIELSAYCDNEASDELKFIVEGMLRYDENYKNELIEYEKLRRYIQSTKEYIKNTGKTPYSNKIIAKLKLENIRRKRVKNAISRLVQPLRHVIAKYV